MRQHVQHYSMAAFAISGDHARRSVSVNKKGWGAVATGSCGQLDHLAVVHRQFTSMISTDECET